MAERTVTPSFAYLLASAKRKRVYPVAGELLGGKLACRTVMEAFGAPVAGGFRVLGPLSTFTPERFAEPRIVKPLQGSTSRGVMALFPDGPGRWRDLLTGESHDFGGVVATLAEAVERLGLRDQWVIEELLVPADGEIRPVEDIKVYAFRGDVPLILMRASNPLRYRWFSSEWRPLGLSKYRTLIDESLQPPTRGDEIVALARGLSARLPIPFIRVDCYDTTRGVVVGELTPYPGNFDSFSDAWDERLGRCYEIAESSLLAGGMAWGELDHGLSGQRGGGGRRFLPVRRFAGKVRRALSGTGRR